MKIKPIETPRLILRDFTKEDALWAYRIWNDPEYIKELELLGEDEECCYLIPVYKNSKQRIGTCSFMIR